MSEADRQYAATIVALGCDRSTAGKRLGLSPAEWKRVVAEDAALAAELSKAEAKAEVHHMKCIYETADNTRNYRGSVWWLERMRPEVYDRRDASAFTQGDLEEIAEVIGLEVADEAVCRRIIERMLALSQQ